VAAHLTLQQVEPAGMITMMARSPAALLRRDADIMIKEAADRRSAHLTTDATIAAMIASRLHNLGVRPSEALIDICLHSQDIAIPLGRELPLGHRHYPSDTAFAEAVASKLGVGRETARRWLVQSDVDAGTRPGVVSDDQAELKKLRAENRRLKEDFDINGFLRRGTRPPQPLIMAFIADMTSRGHTVESTCRVLR